MRALALTIALLVAAPAMADGFERWMDRQDRWDTHRRTTDLEDGAADAARQRELDARYQEQQRARTERRLENLERCRRGSLLCD